MKHLILILLSALTVLATSAQSASDDAWAGTIDVGGTPLAIVMHLGDSLCTLDSPDQGVKGIPATLERTAMGGVVVQVPSIGARFEGIHFSGALMGTFTQHGQAFPLTLRRGATAHRRPQTPSPPFPYHTEEVTFSNGDAVLSGTLTLPQNATHATPALVMITGSGLQNRDEEIAEHRPFAVLADALARAGIATLRYDDRGFGRSTGDVTLATTDTFALDARAGIELLRQRFDRVGALGHSEGGTIALMLAADGQVDCAVCLAAMVLDGKGTLLTQNRYALEQAGYPAATVNAYCEALGRLFDSLAGGGAPVADSNGLPSELGQNLLAAAQQCDTPYMRRLLALDITPDLAHIKCPVLALGGTLDMQVVCQPNLNALRNGLKANAEVRAFDGLNHLFQQCTTGSPAEYAAIEQTIAPQVIEAIIEWTKTVGK